MQPTNIVTYFIHFVISHRPDNIWLMLPFSNETYVRGVFIYLFILLVSGLKSICKSEEIFVYNIQNLQFVCSM